MAWKNLLQMQDNRPGPGNEGLHLSLHTEAVPSDTNELDPGTASGYDRLTGQSDPFLSLGSSSETAAEWRLFLRGVTTSLTYWDRSNAIGFNNNGLTDWPAALSAAINYGPSAAVPGQGFPASYRIAEITLPAPWILRRAAIGMPPGELVSYSVAKPTTVAAGGFWRRGDQVTALPSGSWPPDVLVFLHEVIRGRSWPSSLLTDNDVPVARRNAAQGRALDVIPWYLDFFTTMTPSAGQEYPTAAQRVAGLAPVDLHMRPNHDYSVLENAAEVGLSATQAITAPVAGFWALRTGSWSSGVVSKSASDYLIAYGSLDAASPSLAVGEGVIEPGQIRVELS